MKAFVYLNRCENLSAAVDYSRSDDAIIAIMLPSFVQVLAGPAPLGCRVDLRIVLFEDCSAFTRVAACTLALSPIRDTLIEGFSHFVTSMTAPMLPARAVAGWGLHPQESAAFPRRTPKADIGRLMTRRAEIGSGATRLDGGKTLPL
jgi:hypothetical protein